MILDLQIRGDQARLPVVDVQHVDLQVQEADGFQHGAAEEHEPLAVVDVVLAIDAVKLIAIEILVLLDQVDRHGVAGHVAAGQVAGDHLAADGHDEVDSQRFDGQAAIMHLAIGRQNDGRLVSHPRQLDGQRAGHVGQTPGFGKGNRFTCGQEDIHVLAPSSGVEPKMTAFHDNFTIYSACGLPLLRYRYNRNNHSHSAFGTDRGSNPRRRGGMPVCLPPSALRLPP